MSRSLILFLDVQILSKKRKELCGVEMKICKDKAYQNFTTDCADPSGRSV
jgi:hypothetical protein